MRGSRRTLINQAVNVCVKFLPWNDESSPDFASAEFLRPNRFTDSPYSRTEVDSRLLDCEKTRNQRLGCYRITAESCLLDWHIMPSKQCGSFLASTHVPASACRLAPHGAPPQLCEVLGAEQNLPARNSIVPHETRASQGFRRVTNPQITNVPLCRLVKRRMICSENQEGLWHGKRAWYDGRTAKAG